MLSFAQKTHMSVSAWCCVALEGMGWTDRHRVALLSDWAANPASAKVLELSLLEPAGIEIDLSCAMGMSREQVMLSITSFSKLGC